MVRVWIAMTASMFGILLLINIYLLVTNDQIEGSKVIRHVSFSEKMDLLDTLPSSGMVIPSEKFSVGYLPTLGEIEEILVEKGETVSVGTPLVKYEDTELNRNIELLLSNQNKIEMQIDKLDFDIIELETQLIPFSDEYDSELVLYMNGLIYNQINEKNFQKQLLDIELNNLKAQIELLEEKKEKLIITSKIEGIVVNVNEPLHTPNSEMIKIQSADSFQVEGTISEYDISNITEGQKTYIHLKAQANTKLEGSVQEITMVPIQEATGEKEGSFYPYTITIDEPSDILHHGFHVDVDFVLIEKEDVISIPEKAVVKEEDEDYVFVLKDGIIEKRSIQTGIVLDNYQEVTSGLETGERIVTNPSFDLKDGMKIVMPIQHNEYELLDLLDFTKNEIARLIIKGMLSY